MKGPNAKWLACPKKWFIHPDPLERVCLLVDGEPCCSMAMDAGASVQSCSVYNISINIIYLLFCCQEGGETLQRVNGVSERHIPRFLNEHETPDIWC